MKASRSILLLLALTLFVSCFNPCQSQMSTTDSDSLDATESFEVTDSTGSGSDSAETTDTDIDGTGSSDSDSVSDSDSDSDSDESISASIEATGSSESAASDGDDDDDDNDTSVSDSESSESVSIENTESSDGTDSNEENETTDSSESGEDGLSESNEEAAASDETGGASIENNDGTNESAERTIRERASETDGNSALETSNKPGYLLFSSIFLLIGLIVIAAAVGGYCMYQKYRKEKKYDNVQIFDVEATEPDEGTLDGDIQTELAHMMKV